MSMKTIGLFCFVLFSVIGTNASAQLLQWVHRTGDAGWEQGTGIALDGSGNVYSIGIFPGTMDFDPGAGVFNLTPGGQ